MWKEDRYIITRVPSNYPRFTNNESHTDVDDTNEVFIHNVPENMGKK